MLRYLPIPTVTFVDASGASIPVKDLLEPSLAPQSALHPVASIVDPNAGRKVFRALPLKKADGTLVKKSDATQVLVAKQVIGGV